MSEKIEEMMGRVEKTIGELLELRMDLVELKYQSSKESMIDE